MLWVRQSCTTKSKYMYVKCRLLLHDVTDFKLRKRKQTIFYTMSFHAERAAVCQRHEHVEFEVWIFVPAKPYRNKNKLPVVHETSHKTWITKFPHYTGAHR